MRRRDRVLECPVVVLWHVALVGSRSPPKVRLTDQRYAALKSATYSAEPEKVNAKTVQRKLEPRFSTSDFIALLDGYTY
jgi:hypothetical protein